VSRRIDFRTSVVLSLLCSRRFEIPSNLHHHWIPTKAKKRNVLRRCRNSLSKKLAQRMTRHVAQTVDGRTLRSFWFLVSTRISCLVYRVCTYISYKIYVTYVCICTYHTVFRILPSQQAFYCPQGLGYLQ